MSERELGSTIRELLAEGRGILAADESTPTITKRFDQLGIASTDDSPAELQGDAFSFSYARALQGKAWRGEDAQREAAQKALYHRARCTSAAALGKYSADMEHAAPAA